MRTKDIINIWVHVDGKTKIMIQLQPDSIVLTTISYNTIMKELTNYTTPVWKHIELEQEQEP